MNANKVWGVYGILGHFSTFLGPRKSPGILNLKIDSAYFNGFNIEAI